ncbi:helix-turn-helix domain-containing protein [Streptomyces lancefieldiae]|uniref:Helix-turn-helix transcriptional regulator n=1 Tax=Streptomyces lancefieldiae TaxID=3075520 RepID=A0ABU3B2H9_9ACTN|nr:helix-turn-helix transcriptional regulator [Streptomyces sp. DSM 40712]MDT0615196.1 helix-turn-helix transcriptional regulator [Streptomyces sp. DSM 40712]
MPGEVQDGDGSAPPEGRTVKDRLNALFAMVNPETGRHYVNADVARATGISASAIAQLRQGVKLNPTLNTIEALSDFFGVTTEYFSRKTSDEHARRVVAGLELLNAAEKAGVVGLFARASGLSEENLHMVRAVIETARKAQGLDGSQS